MLYNGTEHGYGFFICLFYDKGSDPLIAHPLLSNFTALFTASYRIGNDFSFDEKMVEYGCNVFSFDPTMDKEDHRHSPGVMFYNLGLSDVDQERPRHPRPWHKFDKMKWKTRTFKTIMLELGHFKVIQIFNLASILGSLNQQVQLFIDTYGCSA